MKFVYRQRLTLLLLAVGAAGTIATGCDSDDSDETGGGSTAGRGGSSISRAGQAGAPTASSGTAGADAAAGTGGNAAGQGGSGGAGGAVQHGGESGGPSTNDVATAVTIPATANVWGAGHALPPDPSGHGAGVLPIVVELPPGTGRTLTVTDVSGSLDFDGAGTVLSANDADGFVGTLDGPLPEGPAPSLGGIAGLKVPACAADECVVRGAFLAAVFLADSEPADAAPAAYTIDPTAASVEGVSLRQTIFIGDGLDGPTAGTGDVQLVQIPDGATRLFLGFFDAYGPGGPIGSYDDNTGQLLATVTIKLD